jgi:uncharacterized protein YkwD
MINEHNRRHRRRMASKIIHKRSPSLQSIPEDDLKDFAEDLSFPSSPTSVTSVSYLRPPRPKHSRTSSLPDTVELVNRERLLRGLKPFRSSVWLNELAFEQAESMAIKGTVFHSVTTIEDLMLALSSTEVAENIQRGDTVEGMHRETMKCSNSINRSNMLSKFFSEFGFAIVKGRDGKLYSCQLFRN